MSAEEEYEPINDGAVGDSYVPATAGGANQSEEYTPMTNGTTNEDSYKPSVAFIQSNYVSCFEHKNGTDSGFDKQSSESSSDTDSDFEPLPEPVKKRNHLTDEERGNYAVPVAVKDLDPTNYPKVPSVRDIAIPPQVKMTRLGKVHQILDDPVPLIIIESDSNLKMPLADESMVFDIERKPVGLIFETFGTVKKPFYSVRFNSSDEIKQMNLKVGCEINFGEGFSEFVNIKYLMAQKGSDASWEHDVEVDPAHQDYSDDEQEKQAKKNRREENKKRNPEKEKERVERKRAKEDKTNESTVYICGLPVDYGVRHIKELFQSFGVKKVNLLKYPDGSSRSSGFVTCGSREQAQAAIDALNMKMKLEGAEMPLAVKFTENSSKRKRTDFDSPKKDEVSNQSYIVTCGKRSSSTSERYKVKDRAIESGTTKLHTLIDDNDPKHHFVEPQLKSSPIPTVPTISKQPDSTQNDDVFGWGSESTSDQGGSISISSTYTGGRTLPPELANPNLHPSPFEDTSKKIKPAMKTSEVKIEVKKEIKVEPTTVAAASLVKYESDDSDDSDPENPSCLAFCSSSDRGVPQPKRNSSTSDNTPSDLRRDSKVLNTLFAKAVRKNNE